MKTLMHSILFAVVLVLGFAYLQTAHAGHAIPIPITHLSGCTVQVV
jgi:hypothetical protein